MTGRSCARCLLRNHVAVHNLHTLKIWCFWCPTHSICNSLQFPSKYLRHDSERAEMLSKFAKDAINWQTEQTAWKTDLVWNRSLRSFSGQEPRHELHSMGFTAWAHPVPPSLQNQHAPVRTPNPVASSTAPAHSKFNLTLFKLIVNIMAITFFSPLEHFHLYKYN